MILSIVIIIGQYFAFCTGILAGFSLSCQLTPKAFHILHILCVGQLTSVTEMNIFIKVPLFCFF